ncbi:MAG: hypothetical protein K2Z81_02360, partial [Cyanobacteria bacterium]|nr:hypothetical protein [Cyanobacteriota bacterium]
MTRPLIASFPILIQTFAVDNELKPHFLQTFRRLAQLDAAQRMEETGRQKDGDGLKKAANDFVLFNNLINDPQGAGEQALMRAIQNTQRTAGANEGGRVSDGGTSVAPCNSNGFVRTVLAGQGAGVSGERRENLPDNLPKSVKKVFNDNPGLWNGAQGNDSSRMKKQGRVSAVADQRTSSLIVSAASEQMPQ